MAHAAGSLLASTFLPPAQANTFTALERWYYETGAHPVYLSLGFGDEDFYALIDALNIPDAVSTDGRGRYACRGRPVLDLFARIAGLPGPQRKAMQELFARYADIFRGLPGDGAIPWAPTSRHVKAPSAPTAPFDENAFGILPALRPFEGPLRRAGVDGTALIRMRLLNFFSHASLRMHPELQKLLGKVSELPGPAVEAIRAFVGK